MESNDVFLHAALHGAPYIVVKVSGDSPGEQTLTEAAQFAVTFSRAWQDGLSSGDAYWVDPEQVSFTPPSGEYLPHGAFVIRGKKNYVRKTPVKLAIGVDTREQQLRIIGGPIKAIRNHTKIVVEITPGDLSSSKLSHKIRKSMEKKAPKNIEENISKIPLEEIQVFIPYGRGRISDN